MKRGTTVFLLTLCLFPFISKPSADAYVGLCCAHCGGNMPMNIPGGGVPETHEFRFKLSQMYMRMGPLRNGGNEIKLPDVLGMPNGDRFAVAPKEMRMFMTMGSVAYSFTDDFAAMAMFMYKRNEMPMQFNVPLTLANGTDGFTMFSDGFADMRVMGKYRLWANDNLYPTQQVSAIVGLNIPTGDIEKKFTRNPVPGQNGRILPFKMQLGSGTFDPILGFTYQGSNDPFWYGVNGMYTGRWYDNAQGYHQGQEINLDIYGMFQFHPHALVHVQLNGSYEGKYSDEPDDGKTKGDGHFMNNPNRPFLSPLFDPHNYGGRKVNASLGFQYQPVPLHIIDLTASVPIHQNLNGPQLEEDWRIMFTYYIELPTKKSRRYVGTKPPSELGF